MMRTFYLKTKFETYLQRPTQLAPLTYPEFYGNGRQPNLGCGYFLVIIIIIIIIINNNKLMLLTYIEFLC